MADWVYEHHVLLELMLAVAVAVAVAAAVVAVRRRAGVRGLVWVTVPVAFAVAMAAAWLVADRRSKSAELQQRVDQVAALLPSGSTRTATDSSENHRSETFSVPGDASLANAEFQRRATDQFQTPTRFDYQYTLGPQAAYRVLFPGRGCDGAVQVTIFIPLGPSRPSPGTTALITAECRCDL